MVHAAALLAAACGMWLAAAERVRSYIARCFQIRGPCPLCTCAPHLTLGAGTVVRHLRQSGCPSLRMLLIQRTLSSRSRAVRSCRYTATLLGRSMVGGTAHPVSTYRVVGPSKISSFIGSLRPPHSVCRSVGRQLRCPVSSRRTLRSVAAPVVSLAAG